MLSGRELERRAFRLISEAGEEGLLQSDMWKRLGITGQEGSRIARRFEEKRIIRRLRELHEGYWTYRLISLMKPVTLDSIWGCPCAACNDMNRCIPGQRISPVLCSLLTDWINLKVHKELTKPSI